MKFAHLNVHNLEWLVPPWACNYFELAKIIDPMFAEYKRTIARLAGISSDNRIKHLLSGKYYGRVH